MLIPSTKEGNGTGHLKRALHLSTELEGDISIYIDTSDRSRVDTILREFINCTITDELKDLNLFSKIIIDMRELDADLYEKHLKGRNLIAIDEGGKLREELPYLIDILPLPERFGLPNIRSLSFLSLPERKKVMKNGKILVSFGGEDPRGLTEKFCREISGSHRELISRITIVLGPLYQGKKPGPEFDIINQPTSLNDILQEYEGLICSFGLTAFEAVHLKIPVIMINPGEYHEELTKLSGFQTAGTMSFDIEKIVNFIDNPQKNALINIDYDEQPLGEFINNLDDPEIVCPVCSAQDFAVKARFRWRTYNRCKSCGMIYMLNFNKNKITYDKEYFFNQYENQYGKTYLDDFDHISRLAEERLQMIKKVYGKARSLLDAGCAYGPFMKKASDCGYNSFGTDISADAVNHVNRELKLRAFCSEFDNFAIPDDWGLSRFDVLTMWYVIEHFKDLSTTLRKVNGLLETGGLFAFSTPSGSGISAKNNEVDFFRNSPDDHYTIWEPGRSGTILNLYGFRVVKIRITGHHPERFPSRLSRTVSGRKILNLKSRCAGLGDTFEIYAEKVRDL